MSIHIRLNAAQVRYPVFSSARHHSILTAMAQSASFGVLRRSTAGITYVDGLRGVSLDLRQGARLGIIGRNGSGKSTLLKTIAGICWPHSGTREVEGRISSILTVGSGLDPEKSGRANVMFISKLFGIGKAEAERLAEEVLDFTQLGSFFDLPARTYSSGMMVRLSFAISTSLPGDILVVDEVLGAGDLHFLERAAAKLRERIARSGILVLATHSYQALEEFCETVIWMDQGRIVDIGAPLDVWTRYHQDTPAYPRGIASMISLPGSELSTAPPPQTGAAEVQPAIAPENAAAE